MNEIAELNKLCIICLNTETLTLIPQLTYQEVPAQYLLKNSNLIKFEIEYMNNRSLCRKCCKLLYSLYCMRKQFFESQETFQLLVKNEPNIKNIQIPNINQPNPNKCVECVCLNVATLNLSTICRICFQQTDIQPIGSLTIDEKSAIKLYEEFSNQNIQPDEMLCLNCLDHLLDISKFRNKFENHDFIAQNLQTSLKLEPYQTNYPEIIENKLEFVSTNKQTIKTLNKGARITQQIKQFTGSDLIAQNERTNLKLEPDQTNYPDIIENKLEFVSTTEQTIKTLNKGARTTQQIKQFTGNDLIEQNEQTNLKLEPDQMYYELIEEKLEIVPNELTNEKPQTKTQNKKKRPTNQLKRKPKDDSLTYKVTCRHCPLTFDTKADFTLHASRTVSHTYFRTKIACGACDRLLDTASAYRAHVDGTHRRIRPFGCGTCARRFSLKRNLERHALTHTADRPFGCDRCGAKFIQKTLLTEHVHSQHDATRHKCEVCGRVFRTWRIFQRHTKMMHSPAIAKIGSPANVGAFVCETCSMPHSDRWSLKAHRLTHDAPRKACGRCEKRFHFKCQLDAHMRVHTGERPHACAVCAKTFKTPSELKCHADTHSQRRRYTCEACGKCFKRLPHLARHRRTHTGDKPCVCEVCRKRFTCSANLREHTRIHTGEMPFKCKNCSKLFRTSGALRIHMRTYEAKSEGVDIV